jgi:hypothetical protein
MIIIKTIIYIEWNHSVFILKGSIAFYAINIIERLNRSQMENALIFTGTPRVLWICIYTGDSCEWDPPPMVYFNEQQFAYIEINRNWYFSLENNVFERKILTSVFRVKICVKYSLKWYIPKFPLEYKTGHQNRIKSIRKFVFKSFSQCCMGIFIHGARYALQKIAHHNKCSVWRNTNKQTNNSWIAPQTSTFRLTNKYHQGLSKSRFQLGFFHAPTIDQDRYSSLTKITMWTKYLPGVEQPWITY